MKIEISPEDFTAIRNEIAKAEKTTSAEIFAVLAERSDDYRFVAAAFLALWIIVVSLLLVLWAKWQVLSINTSLFVAAQLLSLICGWLVIWTIPSATSKMTPRQIKHWRAHLNGMNQFLAHGIHHTKGRTGVLIFVSLEERYAEILVDTAIEKAVGRKYWLESVALLIDRCKSGEIAKGYREVIAAAGEKLAEEFPASKNDVNELENKLIII